MSQHTPGPWKLCDSSWVTNHRDIDAPTHGALAVVVWRMEDDARSPECEANARLIAKAPELYKIVRWIVDMKQGVDKNCGQYNHYTLKLGSEVMDEMARLVAEIEGEQQ